MNDTSDFDQLVASWLEMAGPADIRREAIDGAIRTARRVPQRRGLSAWLVGPGTWPAFGRRHGFTFLSPVARVAVLLVLAVSLAAGAAFIGGRLVVAPVEPTPSPSVTPTPSPSVEPTFGSPLPSGDHNAGTWTELASLTKGRVGHTATRLVDGEVLVVGGSTTLNGDGTSSAELYEPGTRSWVAVAPTIGVHKAHTATLLRDGKVLIVGGSDSPFAESYDPGTRSWTATGTMSAIRAGHTATLLLSGSVLVAGGRGPSATTELYDPLTGRWRPTGAMADGRFGHTATLLRDGRVLVVGGSGASGELATAELYDPDRGTWSAAATAPRSFLGHSATLLTDGTVLVAGGWHFNNGHIEASAFDYNPMDDTWSPAANLLEARGGHSATLLGDGRVLVAGGISNGQQTCGNILPTAEMFDPVRRTWSAARPMASVRYDHAATLLIDGSVLITGGTDSGCMRDPLASVELYVPGPR